MKSEDRRWDCHTENGMQIKPDAQGEKKTTVSVGLGTMREFSLKNTDKI